MSLLPQFPDWNAFQSKHSSGRPARFYATRRTFDPRDSAQTLSAATLERLAELIAEQEQRDARRKR